jgi:lipopolysaccharide export system ATP-binding protein
MDQHQSILLAEGLEKTYGRRTVVAGVSLRVDEGEIVGLLGPNGAGKSTSFRMICGLIEPDRGRVWLNGLDVTEWPMFRRARDGRMGYLPQESSVFRKLTVEQNVLALLELLGMGSRERRARCDELLEQFKITHIRKSRAARLSGGERRRLEIARCLVSNPRIVMLDEPFAGIDPVTVQSIQGIIQDLQAAGIAVLITDHAAREILQTVDRCYVISKGKVLVEGTPAEVKRHPQVQAEYLGDLDGTDHAHGGAAHSHARAATSGSSAAGPASRKASLSGSPIASHNPPGPTAATPNAAVTSGVGPAARVPKPHFLSRARLALSRRRTDGRPTGSDQADSSE